MISESENQRLVERRNGWKVWGSILAQFLGVGVLALVGAQLAFLATVPNLPKLPLDGNTFWSVFSTWPPATFFLAYGMILLPYEFTLSMDKEGLHAFFTRWLQKIRNMQREAIIATMTVSIFLLPFILFAPLIFAYIGALAICAIALCMLFVKARRSGLPQSLVVSVAALLFGFIGSYFLSSQSPSDFACKAPFELALKSGEILPCRQLIALDGKPLWLVQGPESSRLILRHEVDDRAVDRALGLANNG